MALWLLYFVDKLFVWEISATLPHKPTVLLFYLSAGVHRSKSNTNNKKRQNKHMGDQYLDVEAIENASSLVNSILLSKGYVTKKLLFPTINWSELSRGQPDHFQTPPEITEPLYDNDKNTINIIYLLVQLIDRNAAQSKQFNSIISQKDSHIETLEAKIRSLESQVKAADKHINEFNQVDRNVMNTRLKELQRINKLQGKDLGKLKRWCDDLKAKYRVEINKKNLEVDLLKDKLLDKRNLSSTISLGIPLKDKTRRLGNSINGGSNGAKSLDSNSNSHTTTGNPLIVYNNNPVINNPHESSEVVQLSPRVQGVLSKEYENIIVELTQLVDNLITENYRFSVFVNKVNQHMSNVNSQISSFNSSSNNLQIPKPSETINLDLVNPEAGTNVSDIVNELLPFDLVAKPLLNNIYKNYHYLTDLVAYSTSHETTTDSNASERIAKLTEELSTMQQNWKEAIRALDEWKKVNVD